MSTDTSGVVTALDGAIIERFTAAVAGLGEVITDRAVMTARGHDFWEIISAALELGGTITGEHGVGTEKIAFMTQRFTPVEIAAQRAIKKAFDPAGLLNPGIMLPEPSPDEPDTEAFGAAVRDAPPSNRSTATWPNTVSPVPRFPPRAATVVSANWWPPPPVTNASRSGTHCSAQASP